MPQLLEWMIHHPRDWTTPQAKAYQSHVVRMTAQALVPTLQALGPTATAAILQAVLIQIVQANRLSARDVCSQLANTFEVLEELDPLKGAVAQ